MKIAIVHPFFSVKGGAEAVSASIISCFLDQGHDVSVFVAESIGKARQGLAVLGLEERLSEIGIVASLAAPLWNKVSKPLALLGYALLLRDLRSRNILRDFDLVFSTYGECDLAGRLGTAIFIHYPVFPVGGAQNERIGGRTQNSPLLRRFYQLCCKRLAGYGALPAHTLCLTNSKWTAHEIRACVPGSAPRVVYCPVKPLSNETHGGASVWDEATPFRIVCLGRLVGYKGHDALVSAAKKAAEKSGRASEVAFIGRGSEEDARAISALSSDDLPVTVLRNASRDQISQCLASAHVGVSAFRFEHFGIAVAELQQFGLPVLVPNGGGQTEIVPDERFIYADNHDLADKLALLMSNRDDYAALSLAATKKTNCFSTEAFHGRTEAALAEAFGPAITERKAP